jgi:ribose/xylose/arabinose/galactoside ABC-type transport system permease subunit
MSATTLQELAAKPKLDETSTSTKVKHFLGDYGILVIFAAVFVYLSLFASHFLDVDNLTNVVRQSSIIGFIALGMTYVMITAGIDLSVGSVVGVVGVIVAMASPGASGAFIVPLLVGLAVGAFVGFLSSAMIVWGRILPFLATLAMLALARSAALVITGGEVKTDLSSPFEWLGSGMIGPIPVPVIIFFAMAIVADFVLSKTKFGYHVYAVGGDEESSQKVGISAKRVLIAVYVISGVCAAVAGMVLTARLDAAAPLAGTGYELQAIAAVVIGGTSLFGGIGTIRGTVIGVLLVGMVLNGMDLLGISSYYQQGVQGLILVLAVLLNRWRTD